MKKKKRKGTKWLKGENFGNRKRAGRGYKIHKPAQKVKGRKAASLIFQQLTQGSTVWKPP